MTTIAQFDSTAQSAAYCCIRNYIKEHPYDFDSDTLLQEIRSECYSPELKSHIERARRLIRHSCDESTLDNLNKYLKTFAASIGQIITNIEWYDYKYGWKSYRTYLNHRYSKK